MKIIAAALLFVLSFVPLAQTQAPVTHHAVIARAHKTTHKIITGARVGPDLMCSATAIARHALLTASHCESPSDKIEIDGDDAAIIGIIRDDNDHSIILTDRLFTDAAEVKEALPEVGDDVFIIGNPATMNDVLRKGYVAKVQQPQGLAALFGAPTLIVYDMNAFEGDSGSGIFNEKGEVTGVVSVGHIDKDKQDPAFLIKLMAGLPLQFTTDQLDKAKKF